MSIPSSQVRRMQAGLSCHSMTPRTRRLPYKRPNCRTLERNIKHLPSTQGTAFRATPNLFGIPTETTGFSEQEFKESFRLYNRTMVKPIQVLIADMFEKALGEKGVLSITPFTLDGAGEDNVR